jgi:hypothetical protein
MFNLMMLVGWLSPLWLIEIRFTVHPSLDDVGWKLKKSWKH